MLPLLMIDFYKATHHEQYPKGLTKLVSYYTPRLSRLPDTDKLTFFGLQAFCKEYLIDAFNNEFFNKRKEDVVKEYNRVLTATLGPNTYDSKKIEDLHDLGYLPLQILAVPEGTRTPMGVPQIEITNTHPRFAWLVNTIETMLSCTLWHTQVSAEVGYRYREIVNKYHALSCDDTVPASSLLGDFSMRGQHSVESATKSSAAWLLSFRNTATVPAIMWLEDNYECDCTKDIVGLGAISTEHSVMCSNFTVDGDEITGIRRLLREVYPHNNFSMVSDSYDYWNLVKNILPQLHDEIMEHDGCLSIRGDSGDPVEVIAGLPLIAVPKGKVKSFDDLDIWIEEEAFDNHWLDECDVLVEYNDKIYKAHIFPNWTSERGGLTDNDYGVIESYGVDIEDDYEPCAEDMGTVWALWKEFGGSANTKGYKVLNPHVKAIYGDSITPQRCEEIYKRLTDKGFAVNNVSLGVGSFSFMCLENKDGSYSPYTRDTFGIAVKATYGEIKNRPFMIYKAPKALSWKKSQRGCCTLAPDCQSYTDGHTWKELTENPDIDEGMELVFADSKMKRTYSLDEIRQRLHGGNFDGVY